MQNWDIKLVEGETGRGGEFEEIRRFPLSLSPLLPLFHTFMVIIKLLLLSYQLIT